MASVVADVLRKKKNRDKQQNEGKAIHVEIDIDKALLSMCWFFGSYD